MFKKYRVYATISGYYNNFKAASLEEAINEAIVSGMTSDILYTKSDGEEIVLAKYSAGKGVTMVTAC